MDAMVTMLIAIPGGVPELLRTIGWVAALLMVGTFVGIRLWPQRTKKIVEERWRQEIPPTIGGIFFFVAVVVAGLLYYLRDWPATLLSADQWNLLLLGCLLLFLLGWLDDVYGTKPLPKFIGQFMSALLVIVAGLYVPVVHTYWVDVLLSVGWVVALINAFNFIDNMDGIAGSVALLIAAVIIVHLFPYPVSLVYIFLLVTLAVFLYYNYPPARIFMGDKGSMLLGFVLAVGGLLVMHVVVPPSPPVLVAGLLLLFAFPLLDFATVVVHRLCRGQPFWVGGKDHLAHILAIAFRSEWKVIYTVALLQIGFLMVFLLGPSFWLWGGLLWGLVWLALQWLYLRFVPAPYAASRRCFPFFNPKKTHR